MERGRVVTKEEGKREDSVDRLHPHQWPSVTTNEEARGGDSFLCDVASSHESLPIPVILEKRCLPLFFYFQV
jgi:hypothetical protein